MQTIYFEDKGQDFLEWDIDIAGFVVGCRPFQAQVWFGTLVQDVREGSQPIITSPRDGVPRRLNYKIISIREADNGA